MQNRLENTVSNLSIQAENLQAAEASICDTGIAIDSDTDIAIEMMLFVRSQILESSAVAMPGQANSYLHMLLNIING